MKPVPTQKNSTTHTCNFTKKTFLIKEELSCPTENTIYSLPCTKGSGTFIKKPGKTTKDLNGKDSESYLLAGTSQLLSCTNEAIYIGKTIQEFRKRMDQHRRSGFHFSLPGHMQFIAHEQVKSKDPFIILARESLWIRTYQSISHGFNSHQ